MKNTFKITLLIAFTFSFMNANAIIKERNNKHPGNTGPKAYIYDPVSDRPPQHLDGPESQTTFFLGDDFTIGNGYDILLMEEDDFGDNGLLDWQVIYVFKQDTTVSRSWYDNFKDGNIFMSWETIQGAIGAGHSTVYFWDGADNTSFQVGDWKAINILEGISFSQIEFTILPNPGQNFNPNDAPKVDTKGAAVNADSSGSGAGFDFGETNDKAIIDREEE